MYKWGKPNQNSHKYKHAHNEYDPKTPTFSSSILPQLRNSTKTHPRKTDQEHNLPGAFREEKMSTLRRACLVEKLVENKFTPPGKKNPPTPTKRTLLEEFELQQDTLFLKTTTKTEYSVFLTPKSGPPSPRPGPVRTRSNEVKVPDEGLEKNRSRAQKIYSNLKNLKQPISPGARLSSLISSMFVKDGKKMKNKKEFKSSDPISTTTRSSSSVSSFSKSCLSRANSPTSSSVSSSSNRKKFPDGSKRTVRFCPSVNVILDEDDHGHDYDYDYNYDPRGMRKFGGLERESEKVQKQRQLEEVALDLLNGYWDAKLSSKSHDQSVKRDYGVNHGGNYGQEEDNYDDDDDGLSCSSSDLFELDNLSLIRDELPVYESTRFDSKFL